MYRLRTKYDYIGELWHNIRSDGVFKTILHKLISYISLCLANDYSIVLEYLLLDRLLAFTDMYSIFYYILILTGIDLVYKLHRRLISIYQQQMPWRIHLRIQKSTRKDPKQYHYRFKSGYLKQRYWIHIISTDYTELQVTNHIGTYKSQQL